VSQSAPAEEILVEKAVFGPNAQGTIEATFAFEISPALYRDVVIEVSRDKKHVENPAAAGDTSEAKCVPQSDRSESGDANDTLNHSCVRVLLPFGTAKPSIAASLGTPDGNGLSQLTTKVSANGIVPSKMIVLEVRAGTTLLMHQTLVPDLVGKVQAEPAIPVVKGTSKICIVAAVVDADGETAEGRSAMPDYCSDSASLPSTVSVTQLSPVPTAKTVSVPKPPLKPQKAQALCKVNNSENRGDSALTALSGSAS
jgi:hypothetical protein